MNNKIDIDDIFLQKYDLLTAGDYADIECNDCIGCENSCCRELSEQITLDAFDIALLKEGLGRTFDELLDEGLVTIKVINDVPLPIFGNKPDRKECVFLKEDGRCSIHPWRAGICRMYPLARLWQENGNFAYYLQPGECVHRTVKSTRVSDWLGYEDYESYERIIKEYHACLREYRTAYCTQPDPEEKQKIMEEFFSKHFRQTS